MSAAALPTRRNAVTCLLGAWAMSGLARAGGAAGLRIVTEELPPFNMTQDGKVTGLSTEVVQAVLAQADVPAAIEVMPWARAYDLALNSSTPVLIYSITRTVQRERLFKWVGVVAPTQQFLYSLAERRLVLGNLDQARQYQIATVNEDAGEQYLVSKGMVVGQNLQSSARYELNYEKLKRGRVDLWVCNELNANYLVRRAGDDPTKVLVRALALPDLGVDGGLSMAFSLSTPDATVERFRRALETLRKNGTYERIHRRWL